MLDINKNCESISIKFLKMNVTLGMGNKTIDFLSWRKEYIYKRVNKPQLLTNGYVLKQQKSYH